MEQPRSSGPTLTLTLPQALQRAWQAFGAGQVREAEQWCRAILNGSNTLEAWLLLGLIQARRNEHEAALASFRQAEALNPRHPSVQRNIGAALLALHRPHEAMECMDRAVEYQPDQAEVWFRRGNLCLELRRFQEALNSFDEALALQSDFPQALNNRGNVLLALNSPREALTCFENALRLKPDYDRALNNCGNALLALKRPGEALPCFEKAVALRPDNAKAINNLTAALVELKRYDEAVLTATKLLAVSPGYPYARGLLCYSMRQACHWPQLETMQQQLDQTIREGGKGDFPFRYLAGSSSPALQRLCAQQFSADKHPVAPPQWRGERYRHDRIRVAYLSADFHNHATTHLMAELLERHDPDRFEIYAMSFGPNVQDAMRQRLQRALPRFIDVRLESDLDIAKRLRELEIDIAVDLKGYTTDSRFGIFSHRPCPIQVNWLGYPGTLGTDCIDYLIADAVIVPDHHRGFYHEQVVRLPDSYQPNDTQRPMAEQTPTRREAGLPENGFVFCCFNNSYKITPDVFDIWMRLLKRVEGSVLWLLEDHPLTADRLRQEASNRDVSPERLVFATRLKPAEHLARHRLADLFVDTLPVNAHTTASDALWAGLPVLTCLGNTFAGRVAGSLLRAAGLPELVTDNAADYEALAMHLAQNPPQLQALRERLARGRDSCPLFDTDRFRRHLETAYTGMWERYQRGERPTAFDVAAQVKPNSPSQTSPADTSKLQIPKMLHIVWVGDESKRPDNCIQTWIDRNPAWTVKIWGNKELAETPWKNANHIQAMSQREWNGVADMMRWEILYRHGGFAVDADSICICSLPDWLLECESFACWENELARPGLIAAGYVASVPGNPFLLSIINDIHQEVSVTHDMAWKTVGPMRLTQAYKKYRYTGLTILPSHFFIPEHFSGVKYQGKGPVYAHQEWGSTRKIYNSLHRKAL